MVVWNANQFLKNEIVDLSVSRDLLSELKSLDVEWTGSPSPRYLRLMVECLLRVGCGYGDENSSMSKNIMTISRTKQALLSGVAVTNYGSRVEGSLYALVDACVTESEAMPDASQWDSCLKGLQVLGWHVYYEHTIMKALMDGIDKHVVKECTGEYDSPLLQQMRDWISTTIRPFAHALLLVDGSAASRVLDDVLEKALCRSLSRLRATELFEIVTDFPDSAEAVRELKTAASVSKTLSHVGHTFRAIINKRLLHLGATTSQILDMYVSMIKAIRIIDPSDLLLNFVAAPIRLYLVSRKDTVRCIVESLIEGEGSELHSELRRGGPLEYLPDSDDEDGGPGRAWEPRSRNAELEERGSHGLDILALLVSIYGSTDIFVSEYRSIIAEKILSNSEFKYDHEVAILELLKIRFGEDPLQSCEVMLRDLEESGRITSAIKTELKKGDAAAMEMDDDGDAENKSDEEKYPYDCVIVSDNYWPQLHSGEAVHHPVALALMDTYNNAYHNLKKPRKLHPLPLLGHVELELDFDDGSTRTFNVNPIQATLILHLGDSGRMSAAQLSELTHIDEEEVQTRMGFWVGTHVCLASQMDREPDPLDPFADPNAKDTWYVIDEQQTEWAEADARNHGDMSSATNLDGGNGPVDTVARERGAIATWEGYVRGMLRSHGAMPLERIHTMLRMMSSAADVQFSLTLVELRGFLARLDDVELMNNAYNLRGAAP